MALKTMLRQLISKWGIMSIDLQTAVEKDTAVIREDGAADYVETEPQEVANTVVEQSQEAVVGKQEQPDAQPEPQTAETVQRQQPTDLNTAHQMSMEEAFFGGKQ